MLLLVLVLVLNLFTASTATEPEAPPEITFLEAEKAGDIIPEADEAEAEAEEINDDVGPEIDPEPKPEAEAEAEADTLLVADGALLMPVLVTRLSTPPRLRRFTSSTVMLASTAQSTKDTFTQ